VTPLLVARNERSFERLYRRHVRDVYHYALAVLRNPADAEDVTQTTFMNAYRAYERGERPERPRNWLIAIAHNVCRQRFRQAARRPAEVTLDDDPATVVEEAEGPTPQEIRRALGHLPFNQRSALVLRELEGRSYGEIAQLLGVTVSAVETLIFRARRALREQLEGSLSCRDAELAISRSLDDVLPRAEQGALRAHLRECPDCARVARRERAMGRAVKGIAALPLPSSLGALFGGGASTVATGMAVKAVAVTALGLVVAGGTVQAVRHGPRAAPEAAAAEAPASPFPTLARPAAPPPAQPAAAVLASRRAETIASPERKEPDGQHRQQAKRGHRVADVDTRKAGGEEEGAPGRARGRGGPAEQAGDRSGGGRPRGRAHVLAPLPQVGREQRPRGLAAPPKPRPQTKPRPQARPVAHEPAPAHASRARRSRGHPHGRGHGPRKSR
jgi:RNA polymerase sigma factor (sigma-70 family)